MATIPMSIQPQLVKQLSSADVALRMPQSWYPAVKVVGDFVAALLLFILTAPLLLLAMALVKLTSRGPALYLQIRTGRNGRPFPIYKIRSMYYQCEKKSGAQWSTPGDNRILPIGRWLRRTHIDELPQLWNVLRGEMSLIGPRPERPEFTPQLERNISHYRQRSLIRPGVTGLAQVQLPADTDLNSVRTKLAYDLYYLQNMSFWLDVRIFGATIFKMLTIPFTVIRRWFAFPAEKDIVADYQSLSRTKSGQRS
jgi:lipopolysaccharide/colanic/teichoic acid biosynthesis glycosyltransferase